jgi:Tfp pilus assembly protein PilF
LSGWVRIYLGEPDLAVEHMARAMRLNPLDPLIFGMQNGTAAAHFLAARYDEAAQWAETALRLHAAYAPALRMAAASHAMAGRVGNASRFVAELRRTEPASTLSNLADVAPFRRPEDVARYSEALRHAGLQEA